MFRAKVGCAAGRPMTESELQYEAQLQYGVRRNQGESPFAGTFCKPLAARPTSLRFLELEEWFKLYSRRLAGDRSVQRGTLAKAGLTPTVQDSVDQMVRHCVVLGDTSMALLAFPRALKNPCYLFEYSGHLFSR